MSASTKPVVPASLHANTQNLIGWILELLGLAPSNFTDQHFELKIQNPTGALGKLHVVLRNEGGSASGSGTPPVETDIDPTTLGSAGVSATLVAGTVTITNSLLAGKTGDLCVARLVTAGGSGGVGLYTIQRFSGTQVKVNSLTALGALASSDTSTIEIYNLGNPQA